MRVDVQPPDGPARLPAIWRWSILTVLAVAFLAVGLQQAARDAPTVDEGVDLSSGVSALVDHDLRMVPEHPPVPKVVAALPALLAHPIVPHTEAYRSGDWFDWSDDFISANERAGRLRPALFLARAVVLVEAIGCAALLYVLTHRFFGSDGAALVASVWLTTPYVVGLSHFAMIDIPFTLVMLGTAVAMARWIERPEPGRVLVLGLLLGIALASRHTGLVLVALSVVIVGWTLRKVPRAAVRQAALVSIVALATVWIAYGALAPPSPSGAVAARFDGIIATAADQSASAAVVTALPMPEEWRAGFGYLSLTSVDRASSLLGASWDGGRWWYFPVSAALKLPATLVVAVVAGWALAARRAIDRRRLITVVVAPPLMLWLFLVAQPLNLGLRLAMPVVAMALVGIGSLVPSGPEPTTGRCRSTTLTAGGIGLLLVVQVAASASAVPHSLAWTPPPFQPAYQWVSDANLDAGQGLYELRDWAKSRRAYVAMDSTRGLAVGGGTRPLASVAPGDVRGWVAVGVTPLMQTRRAELAWLRKYCPVDQLAGGSILVYRFTSAPDPSPGPERPVAPCQGAARSDRNS